MARVYVLFVPPHRRFKQSHRYPNEGQVIRKKKEHKDEHEHASEVQKRRFEKGLAGFAGAVKRWAKSDRDWRGIKDLDPRHFPRHIKKAAKKLAKAPKDAKSPEE